jgi:hypothetical protein
MIQAFPRVQVANRIERKTIREMLARVDILLVCRVAFVCVVIVLSLLVFRQLLQVNAFVHQRNLQILIFAGLITIFVYLCWESFSEQWNRRMLLAFGITGFILLAAVYTLAFDSVLDIGGDNAFYIIGAKSFASFQGYRLLHEPGTPPNTWGAPGLSLLLTPIVWHAGDNIVAFKMVPFCLALLLILLLPILLRRYVSLPVALMITLLVATNARLIHFSSLVLTEIPFIFFSLLALIMLDRFEKEKGSIGPYLFISGFLVVFTYWVRQVALGFLITSTLYFVLKRYYRKALALTSLVVVLFLVWRIRCVIVQVPGTRSAFGFLTTEPGGFQLLVTAISSAIANLKTLPSVLAGEIFHYLSVSGTSTPGVFIIPILGFSAAGYVVHLIQRRSQMDLYVLAIPVSVLASRRWNYFELLRYFAVLIPFLVYYFYYGVASVINQLSERVRVPRQATHLIVVLVVCPIFFAQILGIASRIEYAYRDEPYPLNYVRFLEAAAWAKDNTPEKASFAVRKPRMFYLFSGRQAIRYQVIDEVYSSPQKAEEKTLELYREKDIDYLVYDQFGGVNVQLIQPIVEGNPDKFTPVYATKKPRTHILKLKKWW